jgi:hypothetical protein
MSETYPLKQITNFTKLSIEEKQALPPGSWWYMPWMCIDEDTGNWNPKETWSFFFGKDFNEKWWGKEFPVSIRCPNGWDWHMTGKATNSEDGWTITGETGKWTARASIGTPKWHGWLTDGILHE